MINKMKGLQVRLKDLELDELQNFKKGMLLQEPLNHQPD